jgi:hypothetical protein
VEEICRGSHEMPKSHLVGSASLCEQMRATAVITTFLQEMAHFATSLIVLFPRYLVIVSQPGG